MTDADLQKIEDEWEEPDEKAEREAAIKKMEQKMKPQSQSPQFDMAAFNNAKTEQERSKLLKSMAAPKPAVQGKGMAMGYVFVTVNFEGCCSEDRKEVTALGRKWSSLLQSTGMDAALNIWKDNQLSFETKHEAHVAEVTDFMLMQASHTCTSQCLETSPFGPA